MANLLKGIRVLDLTNVLAGPYASYQLVQLGAQVIKVERPEEGDLARQLGPSVERNFNKMGVSFLAQNAGKQSVTLNLKDKQGRDVFLKLVQHADVVIENFRPGVMDRLGLSYAELSEANPGIIVCSISGFGQDGPMADSQAYDQIVQGLAGVMSVTGEEDSMFRVGYPVCDTIGGLTAAFAISAALVQRSRNGRGEHIDVSMLESTLSTMGWVVSNWLIAQMEPQRWGNQNMTAAPSGAFRTKEGVLNIAANQQAQFERLAALLERTEWLTDERFKTREDRKKNRHELTVELEKVLSEKTAAQWVVLMREQHIPVGEVLSVPEILAHEQIQARGFIKTVKGPDDESLNLVRSGFRLHSEDPAPQSYPPRLGEHTTSILSELGYSETEIEQLKNSGII